VSGEDKAQSDPTVQPDTGPTEVPAGQPSWPPAPAGQPAWPPPQPGWPPQPQGAWPPQPGWPPQPQGAWPPPQPGWPPQPQGAWPPPQPGWPPQPQPYYQPAYAGPAGPMPGYLWGGMTIRFGALMIDAGIMFVALIIASVIADAFGVERTYYSTNYSAGAEMVMVLFYGLLVVYQPLCWWAFQGTPGQRALGLRVVRAVDGAPLKLGATLGRYAVWVGCQITFILTIIAAAMGAEDPAKRTWWDKASGSVVVRAV
jgi:uncharacterized RDD family membrane protein YckC